MSQKQSFISLILLAGGLGLRMGAPSPKQFLKLKGKPIACYSYDTFLSIKEITEIVVVCSDEYTSLFPQADAFASPGATRQDSVSNGFKMCSKKSTSFLIHDAARPFITPKSIKKLLNVGETSSAATLAVPVKTTIKEVTPTKLVKSTPDRSRLFEVQTPQLLKRDALEKGLKYAQENQLTATDDVRLAELIGLPVKIVEGAYSNIKITTKEDLILAKLFL